LAGKRGDELVWTSSAKITIVTQEGRIVRTIGLQHDLESLSLREGLAVGLEPGTASTWIMSFHDPDKSSAMLSCRVISAESEIITTLQRRVPVTRIDETCSSADLQWHFENHYWIDPATRLMWRSEQHTHPKLKIIRTEVLRPYAPAVGAEE